MVYRIYRAYTRYRAYSRYMAYTRYRAYTRHMAYTRYRAYATQEAHFTRRARCTGCCWCRIPYRSSPYPSLKGSLEFNIGMRVRHMLRIGPQASCLVMVTGLVMVVVSVTIAVTVMLSCGLYGETQ